MKTIILIRENIKKQKGSFIGIFLLMFIITISLSAVLCIWNNSRDYVGDEMDRIAYGDIVYWMNNNTERIDSIVSEIKKIDGVSEVTRDENIICKLLINGKEAGSTVFAYPYGYHTDYRVFKEDSVGYQENVKALKEGEIYAPIAYQSLYETKIGDSIQLKGYDKTFTVKGFFEDPAGGSTMMGMKNIMISDADMKELKNGESKEYCVGCTLHIFKGENVDSVGEIQRKIGEQVDLKLDAAHGYLASSIAGFMLILQNIFIGFLIGFVLILLVISLIVIGHSISTGVEQSYVDLGILKAIGFTKRDLCKVQSLQYLVTLLAALFLGIIASAFLVKGVNILILPSTGIMIPSTLPVRLIFICFGTILLIFMTFIEWQVNKIGKITPMSAIRGGRSDVHFDGRIHMQIKKEGLQLFMAIRQITTGKRRYTGACMITALLVFFLVFCSRTYGWLGEDGSGLMNSMGVASVNGRSYDLGVRYEDEELKQEVEECIEEISPILVTYQAKTRSVVINGVDTIANILSEPKYLNMVDGRYCKYDNEVVVTEVIAKEQNIKIGDTIKIDIDNHDVELLVTGINQCANDMGNNISLCTKAYERITEDKSPYFNNYVIKDKAQKEAVIAKLKKKFGDKIGIDDNTWSGIDGVVKAAGMLEWIMYGISTIFILVVVAMTGGKILFKEQQDLGIYKAIGFHSGHLRISFAIRFFLVSIVGATLGAVLGMLLTDPIASQLFSYMGVSNFQSPINVSGMVEAVLYVIAIVFVFAFLISRKIQKTNPSILISE